MARAIWQGTISFGLVEIPVALFAAEKKPHELQLTMLDRRDFSPVGYKRYNKTTQKEVPWDEIVRGYEHAKGEYVVLTDSELERANPELTQAVQILAFVDADEIDPILYEKPYYLAPARRPSRGYALLRETLKRTNKLGIARIAIHLREHLAAVGPRDDGIVLYLLRFADEVRSFEELEAGGEAKEPSIQTKELALAEKLVAGMTEKWRPEKYKDQYARDVQKVVEEKIESGDIHAMPEGKIERARPKGGKIIDLMPLLKQSIEGTRRSEAPQRLSEAPQGSSKAAIKKHGTRSKTARVRHSA
jgi:DNA end-binding protein Ku